MLVSLTWSLLTQISCSSSYFGWPSLALNKFAFEFHVGNLFDPGVNSPQPALPQQNTMSD